MTIQILEQPDKLNISFEWLTSVSKTKSFEYRKQIRDIPRVYFTPTFFIEEDQFQTLWSDILKEGETIEVADWRYTQGVTVEADFVTFNIDLNYFYGKVGTKIAFYHNGNVEVRTIVSIGAQVAVDSFVTSQTGFICPIQELTIVNKPEFTIVGNNVTRLTIKGAANDYPDLSGIFSPTTLNSIPVRTNRSLVLEQPSYRINPNRELMTPESGPVLSESKFTRTVERWITFKENSPLGIYEEETFLHDLAGRNNPFWVSSWAEDFIVQSDEVTGSPTIEVSGGLIDSQAYPDAVVIQRTGQYVEITNIAISGSNLIFTLSANLSSGVFEGDVISRLELFRLGSDRVDINLQKEYLFIDTLAVVETSL